MRVEFSADALHDAAAHRHLTSIFWMFIDDRHRWVVDDPDVILHSPWFVGEGPPNQRRIREQVGYAERHVRGRHILVTARRQLSPASWSLPAAAAHSLLQEPVQVFVENGASDGTFLRVVLLRHGEKRLRRWLGEAVWDRLKRAWTTPLGDGVFFRVNHGGGGTLARMIELFFAAHPHAPPATLVLVDSDCTHAGGALGATARDTRAACVRSATDGAGAPRYYPGWNLEPHVLLKREVENYIPWRALEAHVGREARATLDAFRALEGEQQNHYDMKQGLRSALERDANGAAPDDPAAWVWRDPGHQALFAGLAPATLRRIRDGFGGTVWKALELDEHVHAASLREQGGPELDDLVKMLLTLV